MTIQELKRLPEYLIGYSNVMFNKMMKLRPREYSTTTTYNNFTKSFETTTTKRFHKSFMNTPEFEPETFKQNKSNYMYGPKITEPLDQVFEPFLNFINLNQQDPYNQVTINWFDSPEDMIPMHKDCPFKIKEGSSVTVISLGSPRDIKYRITGTKEPSTKMKVTHGDIYSLDYTELFTCRHGVQPTSDPKNYQRISISFRKTEA